MHADSGKWSVARATRATRQKAGINFNERSELII
jgi:hypothetical protein